MLVMKMAVPAKTLNLSKPLCSSRSLRFFFLNIEQTPPPVMEAIFEEPNMVTETANPHFYKYFWLGFLREL